MQSVSARVSVVIPTYNRAALIGDSLRAVLSQTRPADEIIVVDDGSADDTMSVLAGYGAAIRPIRIENSGELVARNTGLRAATGDLVAFCDSDDVWEPTFLAEMAGQWDMTPGLLAGYADFRVMQDGAVVERSKFADAPPGYWSDLRATSANAGVLDRPYVHRLLAFQPFFPSCMMVSRTGFLALGGWDEAVSRLVGCDLATTLRVAWAPPVAVVRTPLVRVRKHASNFSGDTEKMNLGDATVLDHVRQTRPELRSLYGQITASAAARRCAALDSAFSRRDFPAVRRIFAMLPPDVRPAKQRAKNAIAGLPGRLAGLVAGLVSR